MHEDPGLFPGERLTTKEWIILVNWILASSGLAQGWKKMWYNKVLWNHFISTLSLIIAGYWLQQWIFILLNDMYNVHEQIHIRITQNLHISLKSILKGKVISDMVFFENFWKFGNWFLSYFLRKNSYRWTSLSG